MNTQYLDLLKLVLTGFIFADSTDQALRRRPARSPRAIVVNFVLAQLARRGLRLMRRVPFDAEARLNGRDWPTIGYTMVGVKRLENVQTAINSVIDENIPGDIIECGVWRGGCSMFMKAVLKERNSDRVLWLADSFEGLPRPDVAAYPDDEGLAHLSENDYLSVPIDVVKENFERLGLLDSNVKFIKGWFSQSLPTAPLKAISILRADGDMYESTMDILSNLYDKVSPGGYVIIDDYHTIEQCRKAVADFRKSKKIEGPIIDIDTEAVYWRAEMA